ncbi:hypothetical protein PMZ80_006441 [Knufia obscura]|uniref:Mid2 domain-containing protein n=2 Tax=Knufia TaxID=430999 RepID=A0AAN8EG92_9EURO|nr:hypothetical protein PMZ80_006441 [Knufia obscura]KAK5953410.1 hypothetical protein OHC33_005354 [Knufia fluminis]
MSHVSANKLVRERVYDGLDTISMSVSETPGVVYVGNIGCDTQPDVRTGALVYTSNNLFDTETLENGDESSASSSASSSPTSTSSSASTIATSTSVASSTTPATASTSGSASATATSSSSEEGGKKDEDGGSGGLSRGAAAGIGIALGIIGIAAIVFLALFARKRMVRKQEGGGPFKRMQDTPPVRRVQEMQRVYDVNRGATPPAAGVFVPPPIPSTAAVAAPKKSKSFRSVASKSMKSMGLTPRTSEWYYAANPKHSEDLSALPQKGWD